MDMPRAYWPKWTETLRSLGLADLVAWVLEASGPINILGAQMLYISQPLVSKNSSQGFNALATLLEQEDEARAFVAMLKGNVS